MIKSLTTATRIFALLLVMCLSNEIIAQDNNSKKIRVQEEKALSYFQNKEYKKSLNLFLKINEVSNDTLHNNYLIGMCYLSTNQKLKALPYLIAAEEGKAASFVVYYYLGRAYHLNHDFDNAIKNFQIYKDSLSLSKVKFLNENTNNEQNLVHIEKSARQVNRLIEMCKNGKALTAQPKAVTFTNFGSVANSNESGKQLVVSNDGSLLSYSAAPSGLVKPTPLNSKYWKPGSSYTSDGKNLIFVSKRKDGLGGKDIYISRKQADGAWSDPENLGMHINSTDDEEAPFLSADGKTLFYLSKGHNSMGGYDIFKSSLDLYTNTWSSPENVGYPLNTADNDVFLINSNDINVGFLNK